MTEQKEYEIPEEMKDLMHEYLASMGCRNEAIESYFRAKRAIYYGKEAEKASSKFWKLAQNLYPEMKSGTWHYHHKGQVIRKGLTEDSE